MNAPMDVPGAFADSGKSILEANYGRQMQDSLRTYSKVAALVDREVMTWHELPEEQQHQMNGAIERLNVLSKTLGGVATEAQYVLAVIYENGRGMSKPKMLRAAELYKSAAESGSSPALYNLANMTRVGCEGVVANDALAFCMYEVAATQYEHVNAAFNLAVMYKNGEGVDSNQYKAEEWFTFAAARGHKGASKLAGQIQRKNLCFVALLSALTILVGTLATWGGVNFFGDMYERAFPKSPANSVPREEDPELPWLSTSPGLFSPVDDDLTIAFSG